MARYNVDPLQDALLLDFQQAVRGAGVTPKHQPACPDATARLPAPWQGMLDFATELGLIGEGNAAANPGAWRADGTRGSPPCAVH